MGLLFAIEGTDASGKETQSKLLFKRLCDGGADARFVSFPNYSGAAAALVKMYLNGDFGGDPNDVNAYAASTFFAADRFASFRTDWGADYNGGKVIVADRYVPSNMIHQAAKLKTREEKMRFARWLDDLEYNIYGLPRPDITFFLDMPPEYAAGLMRGRKNKIDNSDSRDIHERSSEYMNDAYENAKLTAAHFNWEHIPCVKDGKIREIGEIADDIYAVANGLLRK